MASKVVDWDNDSSSLSGGQNVNGWKDWNGQREKKYQERRFASESRDSRDGTAGSCGAAAEVVGVREKERGFGIQWLKSGKGIKIGACVFHQNQENRLSVKKSQSFYEKKSIAPCKRQNENGDNDKKKKPVKNKPSAEIVKQYVKKTQNKNAKLEIKKTISMKKQHKQ